MPMNEDLKRFGINIPSIIRPDQVAGYSGVGTPPMKQHEMAQVMPKMYMQQKWFRTYEEMVRWKSHNAITDAKMVTMQRPYRGYRYQLHYNKPEVSAKSMGLTS